MIDHTLRTDKFGHPINPEWLIAITPGAAEAKQSLDAITAELKTLRIADRDASEAAANMSYWQMTATASVRTKKPEVSTADYEAALEAKRKANLALTDARRRESAARNKLHSLVWGGKGSTPERRAKAATYALEKQAELEAAWRQFKTALLDREDAATAAGRPGKSWVHATGVAARNDFSVAQRQLDVIVSSFDLDAFRATADGAPVSPTPVEAEQAIRPVGRPRAKTIDPRIEVVK